MEAIDVTDRRVAGLLDVEGAVDVEVLDVEPSVDSRGGGVVDAAGEAQAVYALAQVLDDGEPQGAFRAAVHIGLALCGRVEHGLVTTYIVEAHRLDGFVVVDARAFSDGIELTDGVGEDLGEGIGLLRLDALGGLRAGRGPGVGPADHVGQGEALDEERQEGRAGDDEDDEVALGVGSAVEGGRDGQCHRQ